MNKKLENVIENLLDSKGVKLCEQLPWNMTLFEKYGLCQRPTDNCNYCKKIDRINYLCNKKTYTPIADANNL